MRNSIAHLVVLGLMFALVGCGTTVATHESRDPASQIKASAYYSSKNLPDMSMAEFEQLRKDMTYKQVTEIVGSMGEIIVETGNPGDQSYTVTYQFKGEGALLGTAKAQIIFQGGKLTSKSQTGIMKCLHQQIDEFK